MKIAIQGIEGSFHDEAVQKLFPNENVELIKCEAFDHVTQCVKEGKAEYGLLAIENTIAGSILPNYNLINADEFEIFDEVFLNIQMYLMALETESIIDIFEVHSHPVALLQCKDYLRKFPPQFKIIEGKDTASEAKRIKENNIQGAAAIAGKQVADRYGLKILDSNIQDIKENETRFVLMGKRGSSFNKKIPNKATIKFQLGSEVGTLSKALQLLAGYDINLTKIQSLPVVGVPWRYAFFVDITFTDLQKFYDATEELNRTVKEFKIVGTYTQNKENAPSKLTNVNADGK
ncbi:MAG: prephenate dehydratase [Bacteroidia bacterium]|nr:prephenate dehydratase [Bacteroidia bacterium]NNF31604.1 prephenate dehydratase [Flavobacteriaceae bacterium]MBT8275262.1 prephenate dehydratase [Bacteroidia bacterium]NNJ83240.1 prephenate dehydratase [Flavobacteriaceae bacterium]NNK53294.1 prephenate dehydratase [Flavobacteriaceae bacterium]